MDTGQFADIEEQRAFWDDWLSNRHMKHLTEVQLARGEYVLQAVAGLQLDDPRILDVGCAHGWLCKGLARLGRVTGTDLSGTAIGAAPSLVPEATFVAGDYLEVDFGDGQFDVVVCLEAIAYMDQPRFVARTVELLAPGGHLVVTTPNWPMWERNGKKRSSSSRIAANHLSMSSLKALLSSDFDVIRSTTILPSGDKGIERLVNSRKVNAVARRIVPQRRLDALKGRLGLGQTLFVVARLRG